MAGGVGLSYRGSHGKFEIQKKAEEQTIIYQSTL